MDAHRWHPSGGNRRCGRGCSVASDRKIKVDTDSDNQADYYEATILSASDYYPFGDRSRARHPKCLVSEGNGAPTPQRSEEWMRSQDAHQEHSCGQDMPSRSYANGEYRYAFNGKEKDNSEEWGDGNHYDYGFRIYNPEIAKFLSVDPLLAKYPDLSPYHFAGNTPLMAKDEDGREIIIILGRNDDESISETVSYSNGKLYNRDGSLYSGSSKFASFVKNKLFELEKLDDSYVGEVVSSLASSCHSHYIEGESYSYGGASVTPLKSPLSANEGIEQGSVMRIPNSEELFEQRFGSEEIQYSSTATIGHELQHQYELDQGLNVGEFFIKNSADDPSEQRAVNFENRIRQALGLELDWTYGGKEIPKSSREDITKEKRTKDDYPSSYKKKN